MRKYNGYKAEISKGYEELPTGAYLCKIMNAEEVNYDWGSKLLLSLDIVEGEHKDFYAKQYREDTREDKKWGCVLGLYEPKDDGSEKDEWTKRTFNNFIGCVEDANSGYHFDWDEKTLKGKKVAVVFRKEEWEYNGKTGWKVKPFRVISVGDYNDGKWGKYEDKPLANKPVQTTYNSFADVGDTDDLPF